MSKTVQLTKGVRNIFLSGPLVPINLCYFLGGIYSSKLCLLGLLGNKETYFARKKHLLEPL